MFIYRNVVYGCMFAGVACLPRVPTSASDQTTNDTRLTRMPQKTKRIVFTSQSSFFMVLKKFYKVCHIIIKWHLPIVIIYEYLKSHLKRLTQRMVSFKLDYQHAIQSFPLPKGKSFTMLSMHGMRRIFSRILRTALNSQCG